MADTSPDDPRVLWAAERTLLAWIRTGLAMMGFGFLVARFGLFLKELAAVKDRPLDTTPGLSLWIGTALVLLGVCVNVLAAWEHQQIKQQLVRESHAPSGQSRLALFVAVLLAVIGLAMAGYLVSL